MTINIPRFKYRYNKNVACIELEGKVIHEIQNLPAFYRTFGYTEDTAKKGVLPDEFIWEKFVNNAESKCATCFQLCIIDYLLKHSATFRETYEARSEQWMASFAVAKIACEHIVCSTCRRKLDAPEATA